MSGIPYPVVGGARYIKLIRRFIKMSVFLGQLWHFSPHPQHVLSASWIPGLVLAGSL